MRLFSMSFDNKKDRRALPRTPVSETLFIESVSSDKLSRLEPSVANTIDVSAKGMLVELDFPVLDDAEIALWINGSDGSRSLIAGTVRWVNEQEPGKYQVGIELDEESAPIVDQWLRPN